MRRSFAMWRFAAAEPLTSRRGFELRRDDREMERLERRRLVVPADRRFDRFEPLALRGLRPPPNEASKRVLW